MSYTVHLFAHDGAAFADRVRREPEELIKKMRRWAKRTGITRKEYELGLRCIRELWASEGYLEPATEDHFWALCWVAESVMERIKIPEFEELGCHHIEQYGLVPALLRHRAPYPLPRMEEAPPVAGFLPWSEMEKYEFTEVSDAAGGEGSAEVREALEQLFSTLSEKLGGRPAAAYKLSDEQIRYGRQEFLDVLETLSEDRLDALVLIV